MMNRSIRAHQCGVLAFFGAVLASPAFASCPAVPLAWPEIPGTTEYCHIGYGGIEDASRREAAAVEYVLTADHATRGCLPRTGLSFKVDGLLPAAAQGRAADYAGSGYDLGHLANNEDFAFDADEQRDTFSMLNVVPQLPTLNRLGWESGEDWTRAAAYQAGELVVETGPIFADGAATIGADALPVPQAFFKVLIDQTHGRVFAFVMDNQATPKTHDIMPYRVMVATINARIGWALPIPADADEATPWVVDLDAWRAAHRAACGAGR